MCVCVCETSFHTQEHTLAIAWVTTCSFSPEYVLILYIYLSVSRAARSERCQIERLYKFHRKREWQRHPKQGQSEFQLTAGSFFFGPKAEIVKRKDITRQKQQFQLQQWNCIWHVQLWRWLWLFLSTAPEFSPFTPPDNVGNANGKTAKLPSFGQTLMHMPRGTNKGLEQTHKGKNTARKRLSYRYRSCRYLIDTYMRNIYLSFRIIYKYSYIDNVMFFI